MEELNPFAPLLGKCIKALFVNQDQSKLKFVTHYGDVVVDTYGDCCSETWFADIIGVDKLQAPSGYHYPNKSEVIGIELLDLPPPEDDRSRQEEDSAYGVRLKTRQGDCDIIYRNSSNGYYGGSAFVGKDTEKDTWTEIKEDWQA